LGTVEEKQQVPTISAVLWDVAYQAFFITPPQKLYHGLAVAFTTSIKNIST